MGVGFVKGKTDYGQKEAIAVYGHIPCIYGAMTKAKRRLFR